MLAFVYSYATMLMYTNGAREMLINGVEKLGAFRLLLAAAIPL